MRRFRFALERLAGLRQHQERAARLVMAEALANLGALEQRQQQIEANLQTCGEQGRGERMIVLARALEQGLVRAKLRLGQEIYAARERVERATVAYCERRRDLLPLEKLRERAFTAHRQQAQAEEQADGRLRARSGARAPRGAAGVHRPPGQPPQRRSTSLGRWSSTAGSPRMRPSPRPSLPRPVSCNIKYKN